MLSALPASRASRASKASKASRAFRVPPVWGSPLRARLRLSRICLRLPSRVICGWWLRRCPLTGGCGTRLLLRGLMVARFRVLRVCRVSRVLRGLRDLPELMGLLGLRDRRAIPGLLVLKALLVRTAPVPLTFSRLPRICVWAG